LLHDSEAEVQFLSEMALRKRGLGDDDIAIARDLGDSRPSTRMRVLHRVGLLREVNLSALVRRLSQDPEPAVRAAAVRAAGENPHLNLADRLREMAEGDPSDVVRSNARHYLQEAAALVPR
jgi:HEAT repeat protein